MRTRVLQEAAGNPLALLELPRMDLDALPIGPLPLPHRLSSGFQQQIGELSGAARTGLLVAAAETAGDPLLTRLVLERLGVDCDAVAEAECAGLIDISAQAIRFRHPLVRAAVYYGATFQERQAVHAALAAACADDADRCAWHSAAATVGTDENVADQLESAAVRAVNRTGYAAASAAMERSAALTPDQETRGRRMLMATEWAAAAGRYQRAGELARQTKRLPLDLGGRARLLWVEASIEFEAGNLRKSRDALFAAADDVAIVEPERAGPLYIEACHASWIMGDPATALDTRRKLETLHLPPDQRMALLAAINGPLRLHADADLTGGITEIRATIAVGHHSADPALMLVAAGQAMLIGDLEDVRTLSQRALDFTQNQGMIARFSIAAIYLGSAELMLGRLWEAEDMVTQALRISRDIGQGNTMASGEGYLALIAAIRGDEARCQELIGYPRRTRGQDNFIDHVHNEWALSVLDLGLGRYETALDRLDTLHRTPNRIRGHWLHLLRDLVEAAVRAHQPDRAGPAMAEIERWSLALGSPFAEAIALRSRALLNSNGDDYVRALTLQAAEGLWYDHARTALLYGEWLRRERNPGEARTHLRQALETFDRLDARPWVARAHIELQAAGAGTPHVEPKTAAALTAQELQVVRLAASGATNREIAAKLFLSPRTVGHHLYRAFPKLGVTNRTELARLSFP